MNKKLLLIALPALMAMSSCTYLASGTVQNNNFFKEEASAKVDVFGDKQEALSLRANVPLRSAAADMLEPVIGVQYRAKYEKVENSGNWYVAVRFVAAIASLDVDAAWTRAVYNASGTIDGTEATQPITKAYTQLNSNNTPITPAAFAGSSDYHYFVAYTLYDIPFESVDDYYIVASVTLSDNSDSLADVNSKAMAARIGGDVVVKFPKNTSGYFLAGTIGGNDNQILASESAPDGNVARFSSSLQTNDSFYICNNDTANSKFCIYNASSCPSNPFLVSDGTSANKIKVLASHNYAFNFNNLKQIADIDCGYTVTYTNNGDASVTVPLIFNGVDGSGKNQFFVRVAPKPGSTLVFKLDGAAIAPSGESGANVNGDLEIVYGGPAIDLYLKEQNSSYSLWATYPAETYTLYLDGVAQDAANVVPDNWDHKAVFEVHLEAGVQAEVQWGYTMIAAPSVTPKASYYWVCLHSDNTVTCEDRVSNYYMVGKINNSADWDHVSSHRFVNTLTSGEYKLLDSIELKSGDEFKVVDAADPSNKSSWSWYPGSQGNKTVDADGTYDVYFRPSGDGAQPAWHWGYIYIEKK